MNKVLFDNRVRGFYFCFFTSKELFNNNIWEVSKGSNIFWDKYKRNILPSNTPQQIIDKLIEYEKK